MSTTMPPSPAPTHTHSHCSCPRVAQLWTRTFLPITSCLSSCFLPPPFVCLFLGFHPYFCGGGLHGCWWVGPGCNPPPPRRPPWCASLRGYDRLSAARPRRLPCSCLCFPSILPSILPSIRLRCASSSISLCIFHWINKRLSLPPPLPLSSPPPLLPGVLLHPQLQHDAAGLREVASHPEQVPLR